MQIAANSQKKADELIRQLSELDDDTLWYLVGQLFPQADVEYLEDIYDSIICERAKREIDEAVSWEQVKAEEHKRRGLDD
jgi:hypothetical protein